MFRKLVFAKHKVGQIFVEQHFSKLFVGKVRFEKNIDRKTIVEGFSCNRMVLQYLWLVFRLFQTTIGHFQSIYFERMQLRLSCQRFVKNYGHFQKSTVTFKKVPSLPKKYRHFQKSTVTRSLPSTKQKCRHRLPKYRHPGNTKYRHVTAL